MLEKKSFYKDAQSFRSFANSKQPCGTHGHQGGIDGEVEASCFFPIATRIEAEKLVLRDPLVYGWDIGCGNGTACFTYFNLALRIPMGGVEYNAYRARACWNLQTELVMAQDERFIKISKMSQFFQGDACEVFDSILGTEAPNKHLRLIYWFRHGWSTEDVLKVITYVNRLLYNLELIICDISADELMNNLNFEGVISDSYVYPARLNKSTTSRTLYLHVVKMPLNSTVIEPCLKETNFLAGFTQPQIRAKDELNKYDSIAKMLKKSRSLKFKRKQLSPISRTKRLRLSSPDRVQISVKVSLTQITQTREDPPPHTSDPPPRLKSPENPKEARPTYPTRAIRSIFDLFGVDSLLRYFS